MTPIPNADEVIQLKGKSYVLFTGLLRMAHEAGLQSVTTKLLQEPNAQNEQMAIVEATVVFQEEGFAPRVYTALGDASPQTTQLKAFVRMAETRAVARAFRWALAIGDTALEELDGEAGMDRRGSRPARAPALALGSRPPVNVTAEDEFCTFEGCGIALTPGQASISRKKFNALLCPRHQIPLSRTG